jgi:hypothetical protein
MKTAIQLILIEDVEFSLFFDLNSQPAIEVQNQIFQSNEALFQAFPFILHPKHVIKTVQIANFLIKSLDFQYIENIEAFQTDYHQRIESEQASFTQQLPRLSDYGIYEVSCMHLPQMRKNQIIFFVKNDYTHLPYKVTITIEAHNIEASYELLPHFSSSYN